MCSNLERWCWWILAASRRHAVACRRWSDINMGSWSSHLLVCSSFFLALCSSVMCWASFPMLLTLWCRWPMLLTLQTYTHLLEIPWQLLSCEFWLVLRIYDVAGLIALNILPHCMIKSTMTFLNACKLSLLCNVWCQFIPWQWCKLGSDRTRQPHI